MAKNIVVCSDGTGNTANKDRGTNVFKLFEALDLNGHLDDAKLVEQIAFYDDGVGTESFKPLRILGGAFGWGLSQNVRELYTALVRTYDPGDRIYLFGFSRGAFTVRTLGGFIAGCGILDRKRYDTDAALGAAVAEAYRVYRTRYMGVPEKLLRRAMTQAARREVFERSNRRLRERHAPHAARVAFIGVWDTVDAVGLPFDHLADFLNLFHQFKFGDLRLSPLVERGCHALAIDDERHTFHPVMWHEAPEDAERISQVWFPGVHSNVGGGYPKQGMSLVSLDWMMDQAAAAGLRFHEGDRGWVREHANANDKLYNSRAGLAVYYRYKPRDIAAICSEAGTRPKVHESALERVRQQTEGYSPGNLPGAMSVVATRAASRHASAAARIAKAYGRASSLLDRARPLVGLRRVAHYVFIVLSLLLLLALLWPQIPFDKGAWAAAKFILSVNAEVLVAGFQSNTWLAISLASLTLAFLAVQIGARRSLESGFSRFWRRFWGHAPRGHAGELEEEEDSAHTPA